MPPGEQMAMPRHCGVVSWDPTPPMMVDERKNGRIIDSIFPVQHVRGPVLRASEPVEHLPDVVQAFTDGYAEATLWIRRNPEQAAEPMAEDPSLKKDSEDILLQQIPLTTISTSDVHGPSGWPVFWVDVNVPLSSGLMSRNG